MLARGWFTSQQAGGENLPFPARHAGRGAGCPLSGCRQEAALARAPQGGAVPHGQDRGRQPRTVALAAAAPACTKFPLR